MSNFILDHNNYIYSFIAIIYKEVTLCRFPLAIGQKFIFSINYVLVSKSSSVVIIGLCFAFTVCVCILECYWKCQVIQKAIVGFDALFIQVGVAF